MRLLRHLFVTGLSKNGLSRMMAWAAASVERKTEGIRMVHPCIGHQAFDAAAGCELCPVNPCIGHQAWRWVGMLRLRGIVYPRKRAFAPDGVYPERLRAFRGNGDPQAVREGRAAIPFRPCGDGERLAALIGVRHSLDAGFLLRVRRAHRLCRQAVRTAQGLWCRHAAAGPRLRGGGQGSIK